ncbi:MAG TPA: hypothetical protein VLA25_03345 [Methylotenera sp.]|nr:hypothetical protein [Methylotenera sp.]
MNTFHAKSEKQNTALRNTQREINVAFAAFAQFSSRPLRETTGDHLVLKEYDKVGLMLNPFRVRAQYINVATDFIGGY